jgi:hypothetical protein
VDTNGVQRAPAMLTLTNVVIQGFAFEDLDDVDISSRSIGDVPTWDGTNLVFTAPGGHDAVTRGEGDIGTLVGQVRSVTTNQVRAAAAGAFVNLSSGGTVTNVDAQIVLIGGSSYLEASSGAFQTGLSVNANPVLTTADTLDADTFNTLIPSYYLAFSNHTGTVTSAQILDAAVAPEDLSTAAKTMAFTASAWEGPKSAETPGWATKSYAVAGLNAVVAGPVGSATQASGTFASVFQIPSDSTAWRSAKAVSLNFIGDSITSTAVKYRLRVFIAGNSTALYDVADQVLLSTSTITTVDIAGSSLATFTADAVYTIVVDASVTTSGFYFVGQPRIQVIK